MAVQKISSGNGDLENLLIETSNTKNRTGYIRKDGFVLPENYINFADAIENFNVRDDDVWVCGFPKTGTTWTQEMVWSIANDFDFEKGKVPIVERFPFLERSIYFEPKEVQLSDPGIEEVDESFDNVKYLENKPSPRFINTHLPVNLLPRELRNGEKKPKVIYVGRNAKDTCISYYRLHKLFCGFEGSFEDFCTLFLGDTIPYGPFWKNVLGFWNKRNDYNMLFLKYEDMKADLPSVIKKTALFLGKEFTDDQLSLLTKHLSFSSVKANPAVNIEDFVSQTHRLKEIKRKGEFVRSGTSEEWKTVMTPEVVKQFDDLSYEYFNGTGLSL